MAEKKGGLIKGLFTRAKNVLLSDGVTSVESAINITDSDTETPIGEFGNKTVYRKCYSLSNMTVQYGSASFIDANMKNSYIDTIVAIKGSAKMSYGATLPFTDFGFDISCTSYGLSISWSVTGGSYTIDSGKFIIEYTKA